MGRRATCAGPFDASAVLVAGAALVAFYGYKIDIMRVIRASALVALACGLLA